MRIVSIRDEANATVGVPVDVITKAGRWELREEADGSLTLRAIKSVADNSSYTRLVIVPNSNNSINVEMRS
jgi:hypothetical protein